MHQGDEGVVPARPPTRLSREIARKAIHVTTAAAAAWLVWVMPALYARSVFVAIAALTLAADFARLRWPWLRRSFHRLFHGLLRPREAAHLTGATMLALGLGCTVLLFPHRFAVAGLLYLAFADSAGALAGRAFGRHPYPWGRTLEGSIAFFLTAVLAGWIVPGVGFARAVIAALLIAALEAAPLRVDDNLIVPVAGAGALMLLTTLV